MKQPVRDRRVLRLSQMPTAWSAKVDLAAKVNALLEFRQLSQSEAGALLGMPQPKVSAIRNYKLRGISLERLLEALVDLGQDVRITVKPSAHRRPTTLRFQRER